jgi:hypothetical protein
MTYHATMPAQSVIVFPRTGTVVNAEIASTEAQRIQGLHGRTSLGPNDGMLFVFPEQAPPIAMTMAKMLIGLDFVFLDRDWKVAHITHRVRAGRAQPVLGPAVTWVLEVPFGFARRHRLARGDKATLGSHP